MIRFFNVVGFKIINISTGGIELNRALSKLCDNEMFHTFFEMLQSNLYFQRCVRRLKRLVFQFLAAKIVFSFVKFTGMIISRGLNASGSLVSPKTSSANSKAVLSSSYLRTIRSPRPCALPQVAFGKIIFLRHLKTFFYFVFYQHFTNCTILVQIFIRGRSI